MARRSEIRRLLRELREGRASRGGTPKVYAGIDLSAYPGLADRLATDGDGDRERIVMLDGDDTLRDAADGGQVVGWSDPEGDR